MGQGHKGGDDFRLKLVSALLFDLDHCQVHRPRRFVRSAMREGIKDIRHTHDARRERNRWPLYSRVAVAIPVLMMHESDLFRHLQQRRGTAGKYPCSDDGVLLYDSKLFWRQRTRFEQNGVRNPDFAYIVECGGMFD